MIYDREVLFVFSMQHRCALFVTLFTFLDLSLEAVSLDVIHISLSLSLWKKAKGNSGQGILVSSLILRQ